MPRQRLKIMVSSSVHGFEDQLTQIGALLQGRGYGYEVVNSYLGTVQVAPGQHNFDACIQAVQDCDLFLGIIRGKYGSGVFSHTGLAEGEIAVTHREMRRAIQADKPRWFLVHDEVNVARQLLKPLLPLFGCKTYDELQQHFRHQQEGAQPPARRYPFQDNPILDDLRILDLYEETLLVQSGTPLLQRHNNWNQTYQDQTALLRFLKTQFQDQKRLREILNIGTSP
jgi:hypothetical protein